MPDYWMMTVPDIEHERWVRWEADGGVWDERNLATPEAPCQFCRAVGPHRTIPVFNKATGRLGGFMCERPTLQ